MSSFCSSQSFESLASNWVPECEPSEQTEPEEEPEEEKEHEAEIVRWWTLRSTHCAQNDGMLQAAHDHESEFECAGVAESDFLLWEGLSTCLLALEDESENPRLGALSLQSVERFCEQWMGAKRVPDLGKALPYFEKLPAEHDEELELTDQNPLELSCWSEKGSTASFSSMMRLLQKWKHVFAWTTGDACATCVWLRNSNVV